MTSVSSSIQESLKAREREIKDRNFDLRLKLRKLASGPNAQDTIVKTTIEQLNKELAASETQLNDIRQRLAGTGRPLTHSTNYADNDNRIPSLTTMQERLLDSLIYESPKTLSQAKEINKQAHERAGKFDHNLKDDDTFKQTDSVPIPRSDFIPQSNYQSRDDPVGTNDINADQSNVFHQSTNSINHSRASQLPSYLRNSTVRTEIPVNNASISKNASGSGSGPGSVENDENDGNDIRRSAAKLRESLRNLRTSDGVKSDFQKYKRSSPITASSRKPEGQSVNETTEMDEFVSMYPDNDERFKEEEISILKQEVEELKRRNQELESHSKNKEYELEQYKKLFLSYQLELVRSMSDMNTDKCTVDEFELKSISQRHREILSKVIEMDCRLASLKKQQKESYDLDMKVRTLRSYIRRSKEKYQQAQKEVHLKNIDLQMSYMSLQDNNFLNKYLKMENQKYERSSQRVFRLVQDLGVVNEELDEAIRSVIYIKPRERLKSYFYLVLATVRFKSRLASRKRLLQIRNSG